jgi:aldehyde dehydrogenase (NAD+)
MTQTTTPDMANPSPAAAGEESMSPEGARRAPSPAPPPTEPLGAAAIADLVAATREAQADGRTRSLDWRLAQLQALETLLEAHEPRLAEALNGDLGKCATEAFVTEISFVRNASLHARKHLPAWSKDEKVSTPLTLWPGRSVIRSEPLGTVLIIAPWNYPLQLCLAPLVTAIAAGNAAVIKPSELAPRTSAAIAELLPRYLDRDCYQVVEGGVPQATALLEQPFDHIVFTGGENVARIVMSAAARHLTPLTLELGGKSPCLVRPDADLKIAARRIAWGKFTNAGQTCVAPDYVLCDAATRDRLVPLLREAIRRMFGDDPSRSADYGRIVSREHHRRLLGLLEGQDVAVGGAHEEATRYLEPTVLTGVKPDDPIMGEEIFGPLLPLVEIGDLDDAIRFVRERPKPLAAYLFGDSADDAKRWTEEISAGSICVNDLLVFLAVEDLPFSGVGPSGFGTYKGRHGFERLSHRKAVLRRGWRPDVALRYAPYTRRKSRWLRKLF